MLQLDVHQVVYRKTFQSNLLEDICQFSMDIFRALGEDQCLQPELAKT